MSQEDQIQNFNQRYDQEHNHSSDGDSYDIIGRQESEIDGTHVPSRHYKSSFINMKITPVNIPSIGSSSIQSPQIPRLSAFPEIKLIFK